ncbi:Gfo/Idh/MocA family protein [Ningiella sp. W23]|uniref:Gfo/Idh/MocA family protein n=1 Tax=Ningiella sp. W23 TaxID=3023715 RepID=UPI0037573728
MSNPYDDNTSVAGNESLNIVVPKPRMPKKLSAGIAIVGCGAIGKMQLKAYKEAGWEIVMICDNTLENAQKTRDEYFPSALASDSFDDVLVSEQVIVVDLAIHVINRPEYVERAIKAGKHVLSQKPFVEYLAQGRALSELAVKHHVKLAVNHNGRWAAHFRALKLLVDRGYIGEVFALDFACYWGHDQLLENHVLGKDPNLVLYDFSIHWFDIVAWMFAAKRPKSVYATVKTREGQVISAPSLASVIIEYEDVMINIAMRASARFEDCGSFHASGTQGNIHYLGASLGGKTLHLQNHQGSGEVNIAQDWFPNALRHSMGDLLYSIENDAEPIATASSSLNGLQLCFAAIESARTGKKVAPHTIDALPK